MPEKDYDKIYYECEPAEIKKMRNEISINGIISQFLFENASRTSLVNYYLQGGDKTAFATFKGTVIAMENDKILFKRLWCSYMGDDGNYTSGKEDHVYIYDTERFKEIGIQIGDAVEFNALVYPYVKDRYKIDLALRAPESISFILQYKLPSDEELLEQELSSLACEVCPLASQCFGNICIHEEWRDALVYFLKHSHTTNNGSKTTKKKKREEYKPLEFIGNTSAYVHTPYRYRDKNEEIFYLFSEYNLIKIKHKSNRGSKEMIPVESSFVEYDNNKIFIDGQLFGTISGNDREIIMPNGKCLKIYRK